MYVLNLNVKNRRGTIGFTDCSVVNSIVVMVQWLAHLTCNAGEAGSIPTHDIMCFSMIRDQ